MLLIFKQIGARLDWHKRRTLMGAAGVVLVMTGVGFAAAAAWTALAQVVGVSGASAILAAIFTGLGLVVISLRGAQDKPPIDSPLAQLKRRPPPSDGAPGPKQEMPPIVEAFLFGMTVYLQNQKPKP
ncbi:MAG: hypothetical protein LAT81_00195 [Oceanicaulis sp.]|nr:hypothetical protein [Oceanicaulis sp.]